MARLAIGLVALLLLAAQAGTASAFQISVQVLKTKATIPLEVTPGDVVETVKMRLAGPSGIPYDNQKLIFAGQDLQDNRTLADYRVSAGSRLFLAERIPIVGGGNDGPILVDGDAPVLVDGDAPALQAIVDQTAPFGSQNSRAITDATLARAFGQAGGTGPSGAVLSTMGGPDSPVTFWSSGGVMALSGLVTGASHDLVIGADIVPASGSLIGAYAAHGRMELGLTQGSSRTLGLYGDLGIGGDWTLAAQIGLAKARYEQSGTAVESLRRMAAVALSGSFSAPAATVSTTFTLSGFAETVPGAIGSSVTILPDRIRQTSAEIALQATALNPLWQTGLTPFAGLSTGTVLTRSDLTGRNRTSVADLTLGLSGSIGAGTASLSVSGAALGDSLRGTGFSAAYALRF